MEEPHATPLKVEPVIISDAYNDERVSGSMKEYCLFSFSCSLFSRDNPLGIFLNNNSLLVQFGSSG
jgi:hypothetical protein